MTTPTSPAIDRTGLLMVLAGATTISFAPVIFKVSNMEPSIGAFYRTLFGGLALAAIALVRKDRFIPRSNDVNSGPSTWRRVLGLYGLLAVCGVLFALDLEFWHRAIGYIGPGLATILANFQVFFLAAVGAAFLGERLSWKYWLSILLAIVGLLLILEPHGADGGLSLDMDSSTWIGLFFGILTAVWYTAYILLLRNSQQKARTKGGLRLALAPNMAVVSLFSALVVGGAALAKGLDFTIPDSRSLGWMILYGLGPQATGWMLISRGLPRIPASLAGLLMLLQPSLSFLWDIVIFSRPTGWLGFLGAGITLYAIFLGFSSRREKRA